MTGSEERPRPEGSGAELRDCGADRTVLSSEAIQFVVELVRGQATRVESLLDARRQRRERWSAGEPFEFLAETRELRQSPWRVAAPPQDLTRRVVEITGPVERKMIVNALNSGADAFMADFEDSTAPTWSNLIDGQKHLRDAVRRAIDFDDPQTGKRYRLAERTATLLVRPRGLHLVEPHLVVDGHAVPGAIVDAGLFLWHNARELVRAGSGPYLYLPKLEGHHEARWWNDLLGRAEARLALPHGTVRATVLIETLPAAFEMDEILWELRERSTGLNCGRWDYIFSMIKCRRHDPAAVLPDRVQVTMEQPCMRAYTQLLVRTCHRRGAHAIGGMAAQIPIKNDPQADRVAADKVRQDKRREVRDGHDGTWVAHPGLVALARETFVAEMDGPHQLARLREDVEVSAADLLRVPEGTRTDDGLRLNVRVGLRYLESWLSGRGCVPLENLMEDAATAEISRAQVWQWVRHEATLADGGRVAAARVRATIAEEQGRIAAEVGRSRFDSGRFEDARALFERLSLAEKMEEFLTTAAYGMLDD